MNKEWIKFIIIGLLAMMLLPLILSLTSLALKLVFYGLVGYGIVTLYRIFISKKNKDGTQS